MRILTEEMLSKSPTPFFVTAMLGVTVGINQNLRIHRNDVMCIKSIDASGNILIIKGNPDTRTLSYSPFRLAYKNEEKLCKD